MPEIYKARKVSRDPKPATKESHIVNKFYSDKGTYLEKLARDSNHPLANYCYRSSKVHFATQDKEEKVVLLLRKHPITNLAWILTALFLLAAPIGLQWLPLLAFFPGNLQIAALILWYLIVIAFIFEETLSWFFNTYITTDERVVDVDFHNLIYRQITDAEIDKIQDVTYKIGGVLGTLFNYGDVLVQTAGALPNIEFEKTPKPAEVAQVLRELRNEAE